MITGIDESKTLSKHTLCECNCKFDKTKCNSNQWWNNDKCRFECKKHHICEKDYVWNHTKCNCENGKYLASIMDDSTIIFDEVRESYDEEIKTVPINFNKKSNLQNTKFQYFTCLFINYHCIIAVSIYYYLIKHPRKYLLPFHNTNNKLNKFCIDSIN